jgi:hypothetical protein
MKLVPAESSRAYTPIARRGDGGMAQGSKDFGSFIMTVEREIFMAKHDIGAPGLRNGIFHSSYTEGDIVLMAGSMLIRNGVILAVRADSGHYHPTQMNMAAVLQGLGMFGVDLTRITLYDFDDTPLGMADEFLHAHVGWDQYVARRRDELRHRLETDKERTRRGLEARHPHLQPPPVPPRPRATGSTGPEPYNISVSPPNYNN